MLYLNAYRVSRAYGGPEEGGWWFDVGEPIASIPIPTTLERGQTYYMNDGKAVVHKCHYCEGKGEVLCSDEACDCYERYSHMVSCDCCGEIPSDCEALSKMIEQYKDLLKEEVGRREELRLAVEGYYAIGYPDRKPHYE